ncbi:MAG: amidohydrolase family protein [Actinomycetota bacterium]|nr:amidohydrolase family protein [Actinomycetota bacterium]
MIVDAHAHMELPIPGVIPCPERQREPLGFMYAYQMVRFRNPLWRGEPPDALRAFIAAENQIRLSMGSKKNLLEKMNRAGIDRSVVLPVAPFSTSSSYLEQCADEPRLIPFSSIYPSDGWESELQKAMDSGCKGLKIHPILQRIPPEDSFYFNLLDMFRNYGRPIIAHTGEFNYFITPDPCSQYGDPLRFERLISAFPDVPFILGHSGLYYPQKAIELARRHESIYLETSFQPLKVVREALTVAGHDRVLFGSDWPESNQRYSVGIARKAAGGNRRLEEKLLGENILALIS